MAIITRTEKGSPLTTEELDNNFMELEAMQISTSGKVLQVIQAVKTDTFLTSNTNAAEVTGLTLTITPSSESSRILVAISVAGSSYNALCGGSIYRDGTRIFSPSSAGDRIAEHLPFSSTVGAASKQFLDSPSTTSPITYSFRIVASNDSGICYINRNPADSENGNDLGFRCVSSLTLFEIGE